MTAAPRAEHERAEILDVLRGFALLGIFLAHVPGFSGWDYLSPEGQAALGGEFDTPLQFLRNLLIRGKFYSLFSLLFGFGFAIQLASAARSADGFASRFRRRQLTLLAIGVLHSAIWQGDILLKYALLGLLLVRSSGWTAAKTFRFAVGCLVARGLWAIIPWIALNWIDGIASGVVGDGQSGVDAKSVAGAAASGFHGETWREMLTTNWSFLWIKWLYVIYDGKLISILGLFALGASFGRWRVHERTVELRDVLLRVLWVGSAVGLVGNAVLAVTWETLPLYPPSGLHAAAGALMAISLPALTLAMAAGLALAWDAGGRRWLGWLAAPGRMALTTYLMQTAIGIGVFYGVGLGWRGSFTLASCFWFAVIVFATQAIAARLWLNCFAFGPVEWLWRCSTYGRWLPLRRQSTH